jgi:hypothetical protein
MQAEPLRDLCHTVTVRPMAPANQPSPGAANPVGLCPARTVAGTRPTGTRRGLAVNRHAISDHAGAGPPASPALHPADNA